MAKKDKIPTKIWVEGKQYQLCLLRVTLHDVDGLPMSADISTDMKDIFELDKKDATKNHFITAYLPYPVPKITDVKKES